MTLSELNPSEGISLRVAVTYIDNDLHQAIPKVMSTLILIEEGVN